jgi:hypothetical protein
VISQELDLSYYMQTGLVVKQNLDIVGIPHSVLQVLVHRN